MDKPFLHAYRVSDIQMPLVSATAERSWMNNPYVAAERCLPIVVANQSGWLLLSAHRFVARWDAGRASAKSLKIEYFIGGQPYPAESNFGGGIITFRPPYLFKTSPGYNLLVRGPANFFVYGAVPIEGLVETDWTASTFTVNWQMTENEVVFDVGDPIAMLVPHKRDDLEQFETKFCELSDNPELEVEYLAYKNSRANWKLDSQKEGTEANQRGWQRHYYQGRTVLGQKAPEHRTKRHLDYFK